MSSVVQSLKERFEEEDKRRTGMLHSEMARAMNAEVLRLAVIRKQFHQLENCMCRY